MIRFSPNVSRRLRLPISAAPSYALPSLDRRQRALLKLRHPQIGPMYAYRQSGQPRVGCALVAGTTLADRLRWRRQAPYTLSEALQVLAPIAKTLEYAHAQGLAHGNLHPAAIIYLSTTPIVTAFAGTAMPSPAIYRAPEQRAGQLRAYADVYALAVIAHELLTGYPPGTNAAASLPSTIDVVLARALDRQPRRRYHTPTALVGALQSAQQQIRRNATASSWRRSGAALMMVSMVLILLIAAGALVGLGIS
jgi:serine/threonine protein kinase